MFSIWIFVKYSNTQVLNSNNVYMRRRLCFRLQFLIAFSTEVIGLHEIVQVKEFCSSAIFSRIALACYSEYIETFVPIKTIFKAPKESNGLLRFKFCWGHALKVHYSWIRSYERRKYLIWRYDRCARRNLQCRSVQRSTSALKVREQFTRQTRVF